MTARLQFSNEVTIRRSVPDVFEFVADFTHLPMWNYAIRSTTKLTPGPVALGSSFRQVRSVPTEREEEFEVSVWEPDRLVAITGVFGPFGGTIAYELEPAGAGTALVNHVHLAPRGLVGIAAGVAGSRVKAAMAENLQELRRGLESGFDAPRS
jgi:hypothetical protein